MQIRIATHDEHRMAVIQEAVKQFRKEHPDVSVVLEMLPDKTWMREKLMEMLRSGNGPDIVEWEDANIGQCLEGGLLSDLSEFIERDQVDLDDYYPCIRNAITDQGRVGALPVMTETIGVFYNKEHFDEAGLPYPQEGWTWDEFTATAAQLTRTDENGNIVRHGVFTSFGYMFYIEPVVWNNGGAFLAEDGRTLDGYLNHPATIEAFEQYLSLIDKGISPRLGVGRESWIDCFIHGKMSMYMDANWAIKPMSQVQKDKFGVVGFPSNKIQPKANVFQVYGYGISPQCANKELAWSFLRKLALPGSGVDKLWAVINLAVSKTTAIQSGQAADPLYIPFLEELKYGRKSAYQWLNMIPTFHHHKTFDTMRHASDVKRVLQETVDRTPVLQPLDPHSLPGW
ncbi:ABC transporter substrate-binding protein [Paenibacillus sp. OAS669]|uniref:ABC transporter substrate-binding protein n=1 Tax=Paenibacillus sp. OAS669 TaxID=2663821 RepID=UPI0017899102|nr:extracellular solute-binding protein [Paenibacillus sp. OAS669]MBE1442388.1 multiple sugar transport system substrate-binding protein [Paenibacillus sp. OAS669]